MNENNAYCRMPTLSDEKIVFVSENDLFEVDIKGGIARRLTTSKGVISFPKISPNGKWIAFTSTDGGASDIFIMSINGGQSKRLTYLGKMTKVRGWTLDSEFVIFASNAKLTTFGGGSKLYKVHFNGGEIEEIPVGNAVIIDTNEKNQTVLGRFSEDNARWKKYRGGTAGDILVDADGKGDYKPLISLQGNPVMPHFFMDKIIFLSDHEGISNIYSTNIDGTNLTKLTDHKDYYVRLPSVRKNKIVYQSGGGIYLLDCSQAKIETKRVPIAIASSSSLKAKKFVDAKDYLEDFHITNNSSHILAVIRGKIFYFGFWEGGVDQLGVSQGIRYKLAVPLTKDSVAAFSDESGEYRTEIYSLESKKKVNDIPFDVGMPFFAKACPNGKYIALFNERKELLLVDIEKKSTSVVLKDEYSMSVLSHEERLSTLDFFDWSPDSKWLVYSENIDLDVSVIKLYNVEEKTKTQITPAEFYDYKPVFDPLGRYIYFISLREFNSSQDHHYFRHIFTKGSRLCTIILNNDTNPPFVPKPGLPNDEDTHDKKETKEITVKVDLEDIQRRIVMLPLEESVYLNIGATGDALFYSSLTQFPNLDSFDGVIAPKQTLQKFMLKTLESITLDQNIDDFKLSQDGKYLICRTGKQLKVIESSSQGKNDKESPSSNKPSRKTGIIDLERIKLLVDPALEWKQMLHETWAMMRDHYWSESNLKENWEAIFNKYNSLLPKVSTREDFSDLIWEMIAETGTSHSYEHGGDLKKAPNYQQGFLGGEFKFNDKEAKYVITKIYRGDNWNPDISSPLDTPGTNIHERDFIVSINGHVPSTDVPIGEILSNLGGQYINLVIKDGKTLQEREVIVKTITNESEVLYREWISTNRKLVAELSGNKLGYIHMPDMHTKGVTEFYRSFKKEITKEGLIVDVRFNGGGNTSAQFLEMLSSSQKITGYSKVRNSTVLAPYFSYSTEGPLIALANEFTGSDGDIFSHNFKYLKLGPLIGKRTWGGVVGIWLRTKLVDGSIVTQPEYAFWFKDVAWGVENFGVTPDFEVEYLPQDYAKGYDPQLTKAVDVALEKLKVVKVHKPDSS